MPDQTFTPGGGIKEIVLARSWKHYTFPDGVARCYGTLCAMGHIHFPQTGVRCTRYVARKTPRKRARPPPAPPPRSGLATRPTTCLAAGTPRWFFGEGRGTRSSLRLQGMEESDVAARD